MTPDQFRRAEAIFADARGRPPHERSAFLDRACPDDPALRSQVESLLDHDSSPGITLEASPFAGVLPEFVRGAEQTGPEPALPERIGAYRILRQLGEGGFGVVYLAEQENPRRTVALKMLRAGFASRRILKRFELEAQTLGRLQHAGIAQIFEAGSAEVGGHRQAFLAMEYVRGRRIHEYVDHPSPLPRAGDDGASAPPRPMPVRERLELFARVCDALQHAHQSGVIHRDLKPDNILVDEHGQPKILDFGVARVTDSDVQVTTMQTDVGQLIGTLPYMSPEQISGDTAQIDTRSDVYAAGVLLYLLLTGRLPYDLRSRSLPDATRAICEEPPAPLSAANRALRGDIETIVTKALEKDKTRRYASAADLAADVRRYLAGEPIAAKRDSALYMLRKKIRRYSVALAVSGALALLVTISAVALGVLYRRQGVLLNQVASERDRANAGAARAEAVTDFLEHMVSVSTPAGGARPEMTVREMLDGASERLDAGILAHQPETEAAVRMSVGLAYRDLGLYEKSRDHLQRALDIRRSLFGEDHIATGQSRSELGTALSYLGDAAGAEREIRRALDTLRARSGQDSVPVAQNESNLANLLADAGRLDEAEALYRSALATHRAHLGENSADVATNINNLATLLRDRGRMDEAEDLHRRALEIRRRLYPGGHPDIAQSLSNLGTLLHARGRRTDAEPLLREALEMRQTLLGNEHPLVATSCNNLAANLFAQNRPVEAEPLFRTALAIARTSFTPEHEDVARSLRNLAACVRARGAREEAESLLREAIDVDRRRLGGSHPSVAATLSVLGDWLNEWRDFPAAEKVLRESLAIYESAQPHARQRLIAQSLLGAALTGQDRCAEAETLLLESYRGLKGDAGASSAEREPARARIVAMYEVCGKPERAAQWRVSEVKPPDESATSRRSDGGD